MKPFLVGIAGGSGSGKSSLAFGLETALPGKVLIVHLDDYFRPAADIPKRSGMENWDDPRSLFHTKLVTDLITLLAGHSVVINTKSPALNPDFLKTGKRIPVEVAPKPLIVVEGFLTLHYPTLRRLLDLSIYLDAPFDEHVKRRLHGKLHSFPAEYDQLVLRPMHERYVSPTKIHADVVLDIAKLSQEAVLQQVLDLLAARGIA